MDRPDLNLLVALDVVLQEGNVAKAAQRLKLSPSAMSRALARLREVTGDPLLVRAGRGLVPTPRALELRDPVRQLVEGAEAALRPTQGLDLGTLERSFTLRVSEGFIENFGPSLVARVTNQAPGVRLRFMPKLDKQSELLRQGAVDLETGVIGKGTSPEVRVQALFRDRFVGVVRDGHPLARPEVTVQEYVAARHVMVSRRGVEQGPMDEGLVSQGLARKVVVIVAGFSAALALARDSDLVATVPERHTGRLRDSMQTFELPMPVEPMTVSLMWHPRMEADPAHRWLRQCVREACGAA